MKLKMYLVFFFGLEACRILVPLPGIEPKPSGSEGAVLTTGQPGNPPQVYLLLITFEPRCSIDSH